MSEETQKEIVKFSSYLRSSGDSYSDETIERYVDSLRRVADVTGVETFKSFSEKEWFKLNDWLAKDEAGRSKSWGYNYGLKVALKKYWTYLRLNIIKNKPFFKLPKKKDYKSVEVAYKKSQVKDKLIENLEHEFKKIYSADLTTDRPNANPKIASRNKAMFIMGYFAAARRGEVHRMLVDDLDFEGHKVVIRDTKGRQVVTIYIPEKRFWESMKEYIHHQSLSPGQPMFPNSRDPTKPLGKVSISRVIKEVGLLVYGENVWSHFLRFFRGSELGITLPPDQLQMYLRHKDIGTTMQFYRGRGLIDREMQKNLKKKEGDSF